MRTKTVIVSTIQPETHYTRFLLAGLLKHKVPVEVWVDRKPENFDMNNIISVWNSDWRFPWQIIFKVIRENIDVIHLQHEFNMYGKLNGIFTVPILLILLRMLGKRVIVTVHAIPSMKEIDKVFLEMMGIKKFCPSPLLAKAIFYVLFKNIATLSNSIIVHSDYTKKVFENDYQVINKVVVIPIGIAPAYDFNNSTFCNTSLIDLLSKKNFILFFGYIMPRKGLDELVKAFKKVSLKHKSIYLVLAGGILPGNINYHQSLIELSKKLGVARKIFFTNFIKSEEIDWLYRHGDMVVLPYVRSISSSLPLAFALGYGKPVIASKIGTLEDEISDGQTGFYCRPGDSDDLARKISHIYDNPRVTIKMIQAIAVEQKKRSWDKVAKITSQLYL